MTAARQWRSVTMYTMGSESPGTLEPVAVDGKMEFHLPPFLYYAALEFQS
jgi:hypothetical protein